MNHNVNISRISDPYGVTTHGLRHTDLYFFELRLPCPSSALNWVPSCCLLAQSSRISVLGFFLLSWLWQIPPRFPLSPCVHGILSGQRNRHSCFKKTSNGNFQNMSPEVILCRAGKNEGDRDTRLRVCPWSGNSCTCKKKTLALHNNIKAKQHSLDLAIPLLGIYLIYTCAKDDHYSIFKNIKLESNDLVNSLLPK